MVLHKFLLGFCFLFLFSENAFSQIRQAYEFFYRNPVCRTVFTQTGLGRELLDLYTGRAPEDPTFRASYEQLVDRLMNWKQNKEHIDGLFKRLKVIEDDILKKRKDNPSRKDQLEELEEVWSDEEKLIQEAMTTLKNNDPWIKKLLTELKKRQEEEKKLLTQTNSLDAFIEIATGKPRLDDPKLENLPEKFSPFLLGEFNLTKKYHHNWLKRVGTWARSYLKVFWYGVKFGIFRRKIDVIHIFKLRLALWNMRAMRDYVATGILMRLFAEVSDADNYSALNNLTWERMFEFREGRTARGEVIRVREENAFSWIGIESKLIEYKKGNYREAVEVFLFSEVEKVILETIEKIKNLSGNEAGSIVSKKGELERVKLDIERLENQIKQKQAQLKKMDRLSRERKIKNKEIAILKEKLNLYYVQLDRHSRELIEIYQEFATQYEKLDLFQDLHIGRIGKEKFYPLSLPEYLRLSRKFVTSKRGLYLEALNESMELIFWDELKIGLIPFFGGNRTEIERLRKIAGADRIRDTRVGREWAKMRFGFFRSRLTRALVKLLSFGSAGGILYGVSAMLPNWLWLGLLDFFGLGDDGGDEDKDPGTPPDNGPLGNNEEDQNKTDNGKEKTDLPKEENK